MRLRRAEPKDLAKLTQLMLAFSIEALAPLETQHIEGAAEPLLTENPLGVILVAQDEELLGYLVMSFGWGIESGGKEALIDEVYISPSARNQGLGSALADLAIQNAKENGVRAIFLETEKPNDRVRNLYSRLGFEQEDSVWLRKKL